MANEKNEKPEEGAVKSARNRPGESANQAGSDAGSAGGFVLFAKVWVILTGISLGASCYFLFRGIEFFGGEILKVGSVTVNPGSILGLVVGVLSALGIFRLFRGRLSWELPSQGRWVRTTAYTATMVLMVFGAFQLHSLPGIDSLWAAVLTSVGPFLGKTFELRPIFFASMAVVLVSGLICHFMFGRASWRSFMIETEAELKKVSWPDRPEWVGSSIVVLVVVSTMAIFLYMADIALSELMNQINVGF